MKNPVTLAGIEPATFRFVAQHLNHCATAVPDFPTSLFYLSFPTKPPREYIPYPIEPLWYHDPNIVW